MPDKTTGDELKKLQAILRLHQSIGANLDLEKVCRIAVREFVDAMSCDICTILAVKGDKFEVLAGKVCTCNGRGNDYRQLCAVY